MTCLCGQSISRSDGTQPGNFSISKNPNITSSMLFDWENICLSKRYVQSDLHLRCSDKKVNESRVVVKRLTTTTTTTTTGGLFC